MLVSRAVAYLTAVGSSPLVLAFRTQLAFTASASARQSHFAARADGCCNPSLACIRPGIRELLLQRPAGGVGFFDLASKTSSRKIAVCQSKTSG
jgi:hypothetical protein